ncbi:MFS transporter [Halobacteriales archaeon QS_4_69_34]|nr:MAG: MFS transporter [Halobacteriales archaeon QS_4_69_34]
MNGNDRSIVGLVAVAHAMVHTYELSLPVFVTVWLVEFDVGTALLGLVLTAGYGLFGLGALPGGILADAVGSHRLIVACLFGMGGAFLLLGLAPSLPVIALALLVWGTAASVYHPSGLSLISTGVEARGSAFAYHGVAGNLGIALGPLMTTLLLVVLDWHVVAGLLAVPALLAGALALGIDVDETAAARATDGGAATDDDPPASDAAESATDGGVDEAGGGPRAGGVASVPELVADSKALFAGWFAVVFGVVIASGLYYRGVLTFLPTLFGDLPALSPVTFAGREFQPADYAYSGLLMVGVLGQYVGGRLTDRIRPERAIVAAFGVLSALAVVFLPVARAGLGPLLALGAALGFTLFSVQPLYQATVAEYTPPGTRGLSYGYTYLGVFGVGALGATLAGVLLDALSPAALFATLAGIAGLGVVLGLALLRRGR